MWHMRTHTGFRPFKCKYCHLSYTQRQNRNLHEMHFHVQEFLYEAGKLDKLTYLKLWHERKKHDMLKPKKGRRPKPLDLHKEQNSAF